VFPVAYSTLLPAVYLPVIAMLCGLIFRGVAFEIRAKGATHAEPLGSRLHHGIGNGDVLPGPDPRHAAPGYQIVDGRFAGDAFDWLSPFSVFCGLGLLVTYATLGCGWLVMKTDGDLQRRTRVLLKPSSLYCS